ncbi:MAG: pyruvate formate lyase activating enzyme [Thermodesulfobacteriota bacterium]|nr:pyruvate formate lyase activating enzyme [Thermodesulfobacteriota bacterium]
MKEACLYEKMEGEKVRCRLCHHRCLIQGGARGICGVRENHAGTLVSLVYGKIIAAHCDPIEKKPLFHFLPGTTSYSIATVGCNFRCTFCQNADISQMPSDQNRIMGEEMSPEEIVGLALTNRALSISYTYTEPTVYFEIALETARVAVSKGLKNVFVSNGYMTRECLEEIHPDLHAANVDLKAFNDRFYQEQCGARLKPVLNTIARMREMGIWLEVTTLLIPGLNDSAEELKDLARFLADTDPAIPWHISRFHPTYRLTDRPVTPVETLRRARDIGYEAGLQYVYTGNIQGDEGENTFCHNCKAPLIDRIGFQVNRNRIMDGRCPECGARVPGVWRQGD